MSRRRQSSSSVTFLGIECGGTHSVALLATADTALIARADAGPANLRLLTDPQLRSHFQAWARKFPKPTAVGIGMAGAREASDRNRILAAAAQAWRGVPCWVGNDLETGLAAADLDSRPQPPARILVIGGTGSCCFGRARDGRQAKVGGWGHLLGDQGSGYDIARQALCAALQRSDETGQWPSLGQRFLRALALNEPNDLVSWMHAAAKPEVAALATEVFTAALAGDRLARHIVAQAADCLAQAALTCAARLVTVREAVEFVLTGGVLDHQPSFARRVAAKLRRSRPGAPVTVRRLEREGAWGAVRLAQAMAVPASARRPTVPLPSPAPAQPSAVPPIPSPTGPSPTEERNPRSRDLDRRSVASAIELMLAEDARIPAALLAVKPQLARVVGLVAKSLAGGGRLIYVGAGTSGRLGVLDASECPPTFRTSPDQVQGLIAGGPSALWTSVEGAEDDFAAGAAALRFRGVSCRDVVVGIAASGRTPFVWGALEVARQHHAPTVLVCFNPRLRFVAGRRPTVVIAPRLGPEVLTGSTRLKAGTATKLILNMVSTLAMVRLGKVVSNLMVDLNPSNTKLRDRAVRIVHELTGADGAAALRALEASAWHVKEAIFRIQAEGPRHRKGRASR